MTDHVDPFVVSPAGISCHRLWVTPLVCFRIPPRGPQPRRVPRQQPRRRETRSGVCWIIASTSDSGAAHYVKHLYGLSGVHGDLEIPNKPSLCHTRRSVLVPFRWIYIAVGTDGLVRVADLRAIPPTVPDVNRFFYDAVPELIVPQRLRSTRNGATKIGEMYTFGILARKISTVSMSSSR